MPATAPQFVNLGTAADPFWQRGSMHCQICGGFSSAQTCCACRQWASAIFQADDLWPPGAFVIVDGFIYGPLSDDEWSEWDRSGRIAAPRTDIWSRLPAEDRPRAARVARGWLPAAKIRAQI